jgi:hypothetical protein
MKAFGIIACFQEVETGRTRNAGKNDAIFLLSDLSKGFSLAFGNALVARAVVSMVAILLNSSMRWVVD